MTLPITIYSATHCEGTTKAYLNKLDIPFREVNIDHNPEAERFVLFINGGHRSTPGLVFGGGKHKIIVTEVVELLPAKYHDHA